SADGSQRHERPRVQISPQPETALRPGDRADQRAMRLYLDDNMAAALLVRLLRNAGHDVTTPADAALSGAEDPVHFTHAIADQRVILTKDHHDYQLMHNLVIQSQGHHPGIFVVRQDNDPRRDLSPGGIVRAIEKVTAAGIPIADQYIVLNHWR